MAVALTTLLVDGRELQPGDTIPERVVFAGSERPVDIDGLIRRGLAEHPKPPAAARKKGTS